MTFSVGPAVFKLWVKTVKMLFYQLLKNGLAYKTFDATFEFLEYTKRCSYILFFRKVLIILRKHTKHAHLQG